MPWSSPAGSGGRLGRPARAAGSVGRLGRPARTGGADGRRGRAARSAGSVGRLGRPARSAGSVGRPGRPARTGGTVGRPGRAGLPCIKNLGVSDKIRRPAACEHPVLVCGAQRRGAKRSCGLGARGLCRRGGIFPGGPRWTWFSGKQDGFRDQKYGLPRISKAPARDFQSPS